MLYYIDFGEKSWELFSQMQIYMVVQSTSQNAQQNILPFILPSIYHEYTLLIVDITPLQQIKII